MAFNPFLFKNPYSESERLAILKAQRIIQQKELEATETEIEKLEPKKPPRSDWNFIG